MSIAHTDVGAYALGLLEEEDRLAFEEHLGECGSCTAELGGFAGMRSLLEGIGPVEVDDEPDEVADQSGNIADLFERKRRDDRRRRRGTLVIGLAAGVAVVAGGVAAGSAIVSPSDVHHHGSPAADVIAHGLQHKATDPTTHAVAIVATRKWGRSGTEVGLDLAGIRGPLTCRLVAVTRSGQQQPVTEWGVPPKGYGVPGSPEHLQVHGGIEAKATDIARYDVLVEGGGKLISIAV